MAFHILVEKKVETETDTEVQYQFYDTAYKENKGVLNLNKKIGTCSIITPIKSEAISSRACMKVLQHWEKGEFPEVAEWAS